TERRQAEEALREREARLSTIVQSEPECVKIVAADGTLLEMNPAGLRMIEADDSAQVIGKPVSRLIHLDDRPAFAELHERACRGEAGQLQFRVVGL
ncbi:PAS domain-containing protein, partial [Klebsiella pneumoniae]|nr:PAS domain-containing protein [Klebsiella pneumoniae]